MSFLKLHLTFSVLGDDSSPTTTPVDVANESSSEGLPKFLGKLNGHEHGVSGDVLARNSKSLIIKNFRYDGAGPDAYFWIGTTGNGPNEAGQILPYPYKGRFYHYTDPDAPVLRQFFGEDVELTLPPEVSVDQIRWISVWCRRFAVNFGDLLLVQSETEKGKLKLSHSNLGRVVGRFWLGC